MEKRIAVCNLCEAICGLELTLEPGAAGPVVTQVRGNPADPLSRGHICPKGVAIADVYTDPDRLRRPLRRVTSADGSVDWEETDWDTALDLVADGIARVMQAHGTDALGVYLGNPNAHSLGSLTHGIAMLKAIGTRSRFSATSVDQLPHQLVANQMFGHQLLLPVPDLDRTDLMVVLGANPMASNGSLMTAPDLPQRIRDLKARGGRLVVLDPRRTETAKVATEHHFVRPGTDAWLLLAMLHVLFDEDLARVPAWADGAGLVRAAVASYTPELAAERCGVAADTIRGLARDLATTERAVLYARLGVSTHEFGTVCQWAVNCVNALTGHLDTVGGAMFTSPAVDIVGAGLVGPGHVGRRTTRVRGLPVIAGEQPVAALREEIETPGEGQLRGLLTIAGNPVLSTPDGARLDGALDGLDFMASIDIYLNETTRHADVILPPTTVLERDHYDLVFHALALRNTARFTPAPLPADPDARHDWQIYRDLTWRVLARLGRRLPLRQRLLLKARLATSPARLVSLLLRRGRSGVTMRQLRDRPEGVDLGPLRPGQLPDRLQTHDRRVPLAPALVVADLDRLAAAEPPASDVLLLIGRRHQQDCNSWMHNSARLTKGRARHQLYMHPDDLTALGISDGGRVTITSRVGSVTTDVLATDDVMPGVVSLPHGYGHQAQGTRLSRAVAVDGVSINDLTDPERLDVSGNAALTATPVRVSAVG